MGRYRIGTRGHISCLTTNVKLYCFKARTLLSGEDCWGCSLDVCWELITGRTVVVVVAVVVVAVVAVVVVVVAVAAAAGLLKVSQHPIRVSKLEFSIQKY